MKKTILPLLLSSLFLVKLVSAQNSCGTYDGYLQDEMEKYPEFYKSLEEKNATVTSSATIVNLSSIQRYHQCLK